MMDADLTVREAAEKALEAGGAPGHPRAIARVLDEAGMLVRATGPATVGPRPSAEFPAVDPARDLPKAVELLRADAPNRHPHDALLYGMAADVLEVLAGGPGCEREQVAPAADGSAPREPMLANVTYLAASLVHIIAAAEPMFDLERVSTSSADPRGVMRLAVRERGHVYRFTVTVAPDAEGADRG